MLVLSVAFFAVSANAQVSNRIDAKIPFDFNVGDKSHPAGDYVIKLSKVSANALELSLEDSMGNRLQNVLITRSGEVSNNAARLVFDVVGDQHYLAKILTADKGFSLLASDSQKASAAKETVAAR
jgi:hypothetical protein